LIDLENEVFNTIATALRVAYPKIYVTGEYVASPPKFPAVSIVEADNRVVQNMRTLHIENAANVMYEVNVYSNKTAGKKSEAKAITAVLDQEFARIGFTRTMMNQVPNLNDATIYRIVCRYEAIVDKDLWIYHN
jgi:hypothetical protein